ncbi:MAG: hypothetical protein E7271_10510 [Lachnospiraceae bacterium]|nr:hypothetical protein [Lachnospiraceae bacterium]
MNYRRGIISFFTLTICGMFMIISPVKAADYGLYVGGVQFTSENTVIDNSDNPKFSGKAEYNASSSTLTLTNFNNAGCTKQTSSDSYGILYIKNSNLKIKIEGENVFTDDKNVQHKAGINSPTQCTVTITADKLEDSLTLRPGASNQAGSESDGIMVVGNLIVENGTIIVEGGNTQYMSFGICAGGESYNGTIKIKGGNITATGGKINKKQSDSLSCGVFSKGDMTINGGVISASGGETQDGFSVGFDTNGRFISDGGTMTVTGGESEFGKSIGLWAVGEIFVKNESVVVASSGKVSKAGFGLLNASNKIYVKEGSNLSALGTTKAIGGEVLNEVSGTGWTDIEGTQGYNKIIISDLGQTLNEYKKVCFPEVKFAVVVKNGIGEGQYKEAETVTIKADYPADGKQFDKWITEDGVAFASATSSTTTFTMPAKAVTVTATYKDIPHKHKLVKHTRVEPTKNSEGNIEYFECTDETCKKLFADEAGTKEITSADTVLLKLTENKENGNPSSPFVPIVITTEIEPQKGDDVKDETTGTSYTVTSTDKNLTVTYNSITITNITTAVVPDEITINNKKYKVTEIKANAFKNNKKIKKVVIGKNIKKIGKNAFCGCSNLKDVKIKTTKLTKKSVGKNAFKNINKKAVVNVPKSKLKSYRKILKSVGVKGKKQKIKKA